MAFNLVDEVFDLGDAFSYAAAGKKNALRSLTSRT
jgi:hypothetical protein